MWPRLNKADKEASNYAISKNSKAFEKLPFSVWAHLLAVSNSTCLLSLTSHLFPSEIITAWQQCNANRLTTRTHQTLTLCIYSPTLLNCYQRLINTTPIFSSDTFCDPKARFPLPELTARVDGWPVSITRQHGLCWRVMETGHPSTRAVNSGSGNRALVASWNRKRIRFTL